MHKPDISVIVTAHQEGRLAHRTILSIAKAISHAGANGVSCELVVVLDNSDNKTRDYFGTSKDGWPLNMSIHFTAFGDPGLARNYGVEMSSGDYIAFLDADDLFCESWLTRAYKMSVNSDQCVIYYPEYVVIFENENMLARFYGTNDNKFKYQNMISSNNWNSIHFFVKKDFLIRNKFSSTPKNSGFGYEDWHWYCEILASGGQISIVPQTCVFYRKKAAGSRYAEHCAEKSTIKKSKLFDLKVYERLVGLDNEKKTAITNDAPIKQKKSYKTIVAPITDPIFKQYPKLYPWLVGKGVLPGIRKVVEELPRWLIDEWTQINRIEPSVYPDRSTFATLSYYEVPPTNIALPYIELLKLYGEGVTHVFFIPWLKRGGADLVCINYVRALVESGKTGKIVVISDMNSDSPWCDRLPEEVRFIEFGKMNAGLSMQEQEQLIIKLLVQMEPKVIHNINSNLFYRVLATYGKALKSFCKIYISTFCAEFTPEGKIDGYPFKYFPNCIDYVEKIIFENDHFMQKLISMYAYERNQLELIYTPYEVSEVKDKKTDSMRLNILWAGRFDTQKRPDILIQIAENTIHMPYTYHVYGASLLSEDIYTHKFKQLTNIKLYGEFDGLKSLPVHEFDLLLFTSAWEGIPTILLDAMARKLPVIASNVGGVKEIITDHVNGFLVDPFDDVSLYISLLNMVYNNRVLLNNVSERAYDFIKTERSWQKFYEDINSLPGYLTGESVAVKEACI